MSMSKKDFIGLADALRPFMKDDAPFSRVGPLLVDNVARFCRAQNPRFNEDRWRAYLRGECGPSGGAVKGAK